MNVAEDTFLEIGSALPSVNSSQMFGKKCFKAKGKAFVCFFQDCMVFKLSGDAHTKALGLSGATLFDPSGKGRAMKAWVQVPFEHKAAWPDFARHAKNYVLNE